MRPRRPLPAPLRTGTRLRRIRTPGPGCSESPGTATDPHGGSGRAAGPPTHLRRRHSPPNPGAIPNWSPPSARFHNANERQSSSLALASSLPPRPLESLESPPVRFAACCFRPGWPCTRRSMSPQTRRKTMTEELLGRGDPVIRRLQQAFADEEPTTDLAAIMHRAANYQARQPSGPDDPPPPGHGLTQADLVAARRREPAAVNRVYSAYAPALFRFFMASVGDRYLAEDLTGTAFVSAIEGLPRFRGPVEALGGWLFQIARHDLYDHRRKQSRSRIESLDENLTEATRSDATV